MAHATPALYAVGHVVVGWLWLEQALAAEALFGTDSFDSAFLDSRIRCCRFYAETELPKVLAWTQEILAGSDIVLSAPECEF